MEVILDNPVTTHIPLTRIQKLIGRRMQYSRRNKAFFYLESKVDATELLALRPKLRKKLGLRITSNTMFIHALAMAARDYPLVQGRLEGDVIRLPSQINVGFAVNSPQGLVVPIIKNADAKNLVQIAGQEAELTDKARSNTLSLTDIEGETIALSNLGVYGIDSFYGIVPPPTSVILAVGNVVRTAVPIEGEIVPRKIMSLTLTVDRRVVDETYACRFSGFLTELLQNPQRLLAFE